MSIIGENIRALREIEHLTQQELADIAQVSRETVNKWESGTIEALREHNVQIIREHFGLALDDLRSETNGLAARLQHANERYDAVPVYDCSTLRRIDNCVAYAVEYHHRSHPHMFAIEMDASMNRTLPDRCHALVDPDLKAPSGSIVLAEIADEAPSTFVVRRLHRGATKALLSAESYSDDIEDIVLDTKELLLRGTVFWYQSSRDLVPCR